MSKKPKKTEAQIRADNAEGQRRLRAHRSQNGLCLQCGKPATTTSSGLLARACAKHLKKDRRRKAGIQAGSKKPEKKPKAARRPSEKKEKEIPLIWLEDLLPSKNRPVKLSKVAEVTEIGDGDHVLYELPWL